MAEAFNKKNIFWVVSVVLAFVLGFFIPRSIFTFSAPFDPSSMISTEHRESGYTFINPLLECELNANQGNTKLSTLKNAVESVAATKNDQEISLYYRDLLNGPWYGYNEDDTFSPQSLLKLPIILAYLKIADENPSIMSDEIEYTQKVESNLMEEESLKLNQTYTVDFLIKRTIQQSDNVAFELLVDHLPIKYVQKVHEDLSIPYPSDQTPENFISVRSYSSIFRVLYNSSYLSRKNSEYLLDLLNKSEFSKGLVAGVPDSILVSHKFGIKNKTAENPVSQLHDCGVIYHPDKPYLLCVMTKGTDQVEQTNTIMEMSAAVYKVIDSAEE